MRAIEGLLVLMVLVAMVVVFLAAARAAVRRARRAVWRHAKWASREIPGNGYVRIYATRPGEQMLLLAPPVPIHDENFNSLIEDARSQAREKLIGLNAR